jgi:hypothetical protein
MDLQAGRAASATWTPATYSATQSLSRSARRQLDAVFWRAGRAAAPRWPAATHSACGARASGAWKERLLERANINQNRLNDENGLLSKRQATFQSNATRDGDPPAEKAEFEKFAHIPRVPCPPSIFVLWPPAYY